MTWSVYLIRTNVNALYCGISNDVPRRFLSHTNGRGAKALRGKGPLCLVWQQAVGDRSLASKTEYAIKRLKKGQKEALVAERLRLHFDDEGVPRFTQDRD